MWEDFKKFIMRGNVIDLAVGVIIGAAFGSVVKSLVDDVIMPPIGLLLGGVDFANKFLVLNPGAAAGPFNTIDEAAAAGAVTLNYGRFINNVITFLIVALAVFLLVRAVNRMYKATQDEPAAAEPVVKDCEFCHTEIPVQATRCPNCTSQLTARV